MSEMKVSELIEILKTMEPNASICINNKYTPVESNTAEESLTVRPEEYHCLILKTLKSDENSN